MSGSHERTNYLGIILAVAGLFFFVVIASILMSCIKCCKKRLAKKAAPPSNLVQTPPGPLLSYGSTKQPPTCQLPPKRGAKRQARGTVRSGQVRNLPIKSKQTEDKTNKSNPRTEQYETPQPTCTADKYRCNGGPSTLEEGRCADRSDVEAARVEQQFRPLSIPRLSFQSIPDSPVEDLNDWHTPDDGRLYATFNARDIKEYSS